MKNNRREFIKKSALAGMGLSGLVLRESSFLATKNEKNHPESDLENKIGGNPDMKNNFTRNPNPVALDYMDISVKENAGLEYIRPVTGGVPLAEGVAPEGSRIILSDNNNKSMPCQSDVLTRWKDGSARWVLLDFQANPRPDATDHFRLKWDTKIRGPQPSLPVKVGKGTTISARSGNILLSSTPHAILRISNRVDVKFVLTDREGKRCEGIRHGSLLSTFRGSVD